MNAQRESGVHGRRGSPAGAGVPPAASPEGDPVTAVQAALAGLPRGRWLLAVSGGRDSMVLLHAMATARGGEVAAVACFDHGTGPHARRAVRRVEREAERLGLAAVTGTPAAALAPSEGAWRAARHAFLDAWAAEFRATVVTAHTRDDEVETVVQRLLRDAGPRGLAAMRGTVDLEAGGAPRAWAGSDSPRARPFLALPRGTLAAYAARRGLRWVEDPGNQRLDFQRNRIRHELLPALERARPGFAAWCWALGARAAAWRAEVEALVEALPVTRVAPGSAVVPAARLAGCTAREWAVLWPAIAARAGVVMDRRGIARAAEWAPRARSGQAIPLAGEARIVRTASTFVVQGTPGAPRDYILDQ